MELTALTPITFLGVCRNIALDNTYQNTYTFTSETEQHNFFRSKVVYPFTDLTPISVNNKIRVPLNQEKLFNCNYVIWQNKNFGSKYFYAFITNIEFININMSILTVEIDVMQTWYFDYNLRKSFVVREHTNDDAVGNNLIPENFEKGDYITYAQVIPQNALLTDLQIVIASTINSLGVGVTGAMYGNVYSGVTYNRFATASDANNYISAILNQNPDNINAIVGIFMMPAYFATVIGTDDQTNIKSYNWTFSKYGYTGRFEGYQPHNNKLLTYPFNFMVMSNGETNYTDVHLEYFKGDNCNYNIYSTISPTPIMFEIPIGYLTNENELNYSEKMTISGFPQCSYNIDAYKAYLAQIGVDGMVSHATSVISGGAGLATNMSNTTVSDVANFAINATVKTANIIAEKYRAEHMPPQFHGNVNVDVGAALQRKIFCANFKSIRKEFAEIIDNYFDYYGYATNQFKIPNITGRKSWNYVQTQNANITGSIPFNDISKIKQIYDNGITFWHGDYIGQYTLDNSIVGGS